MAKNEITITREEFAKKSADAVTDIMNANECGFGCLAKGAFIIIVEKIYLGILDKLFGTEEEDETTKEIDKTE